MLGEVCGGLFYPRSASLVKLGEAWGMLGNVSGRLVEAWGMLGNASGRLGRPGEVISFLSNCLWEDGMKSIFPIVF